MQLIGLLRIKKGISLFGWGYAEEKAGGTSTSFEADSFCHNLRSIIGITIYSCYFNLTGECKR